MEKWIVFGMLAYFSYAISSSIDKHLMNSKHDHFATNTAKMFFNGLILLAIGLIFFNLNFTTDLIFWSLLVGFIYAIVGVLYFKSLQHRDVKEVVPFFQSSTILMVFIGSVFLFSETVNVYNYFGTVLIIIGVYFIISKNKVKLPKPDKVLIMLFIMIFLNSIYILFVKNYLYRFYNFQPIDLSIAMYFSSTVFLLGYSLINYLLINNKINTKTSKQNEIFRIKNLKVIPAAFFGGVGTLLFYSALLAGDASKVTPLTGAQSVFIFVIASLFLKEKVIWHRLLGILIVFAGIYLISI